MFEQPGLCSRRQIVFFFKFFSLVSWSFRVTHNLFSNVSTKTLVGDGVGQRLFMYKELTAAPFVVTVDVCLYSNSVGPLVINNGLWLNGLSCLFLL